jgi:cephalosporin-C deacetylase
MPQFDMDISALESYLPPRPEPLDFDSFWHERIREAEAWPVDATYSVVDPGFSELVVEDVTFRGYGGETVKGWMIRPRHRVGLLPTIVTFIGYGTGRGFPGEYTSLASAGYAQFVMDNRGQGTADTPDGAFGPHVGGYLTQGIEDPKSYYYSRLFIDAVRAVEAAAAHPSVDLNAIFVMGGSQGGGIALAAAGLLPMTTGGRSFRGAMIDVPFLSHVRRAVRLVDTLPYREIAEYLQRRTDREERAFATLDYFDGMNFAARSSVPALFSVGLMDDICPPSAVYASYNHYSGQKSLAVYPFSGHGNFGEFQHQRQRRFIRETLQP